MKAAYRAGRVRVHRPWITEPGMWLQYDFGDGPRIDGVKTILFCAWLDQIPDEEHRKILHHYATWHVLRQLRATAATARSGTTATRSPAATCA